MLEKIITIGLDVFGYATTALSTFTQIRDGFVLRSGEYGVSTQDSGLATSIDDTKAQEEERKKNATSAEMVEGAPVESNASAYINKINKKIPYLGDAIDILFSPNVALIIGVIGVALSFFSPLGPIVGGVSVALMGTVMIAGVLLGGLNQQQSDINKQITTVVKEIDKDLDAMSKSKERMNAINVKLGVDVDINDVFKGVGIMSSRTFAKIMGVDQPTEEYSAIKTALSGTVMRFILGGGFALGTGIATLNPLTIGMTVAGMVLGEVSSIRSDQRAAKVEAQHAKDMAGIRSNVGLPELTGKIGLKSYAELLSEVKREKVAMEKFEKDYEKIITQFQTAGITPSNDNMRAVFKNEYLAKEPKIAIPTHPMSYLDSLATSINNGWKWSTAVSAKSPLVPEHDWAYNDNAYKYLRIKEQVQAKEPTLDPDRLNARTSEVIKNHAAVKGGAANLSDKQHSDYQLANAALNNEVNIDSLVSKYQETAQTNEHVARLQQERSQAPAGPQL